MTRESRRELYKLRELVHFLLQGGGGTPRNAETGHMQCVFCKKDLDEYGKEFIKHGNAVGPKFLEQVSIHHLNGNHDDNVLSNKALTHTKCHKGYHRIIANMKRARDKAVKV